MIAVVVIIITYVLPTCPGVSLNLILEVEFLCKMVCMVSILIGISRLYFVNKAPTGTHTSPNWVCPFPHVSPIIYQSICISMHIYCLVSCCKWNKLPASKPVPLDPAISQHLKGLISIVITFSLSLSLVSSINLTLLDHSHQHSDVFFSKKNLISQNFRAISVFKMKKKFIYKILVGY